MKRAKINDMYLLLEHTDLCNARCIMCDHGKKDAIHGSYPKGVMDAGLFNRAIEQVRKSALRLSGVHAGWLGEPLLHPRFREMTAFLFEQNRREHLFDNFTMNTNAILLTPEISDLFLDYAGFVDSGKRGFLRLHLSLHAATSETYGKVVQVPPADLEKTINNIDYLVKKRKKMNLVAPNLTFLFVVLEENKNEAGKFLEYWRGYLAKNGVKFEIVYDWPESVDRDAIYFRQDEQSYSQYKAEQLHKRTVKQLGILPGGMEDRRLIRTDAVLRKKDEENLDDIRRPCPSLWKTAVVHHSGIVVPCCSDLHLELKIGDLKNQTLEEIYFGPEITDMRLAHIRGDFKKYPRCYYCNNINSFTMSDAEVTAYLKDIGEENEVGPFLKRMEKVKKHQAGSAGKGLSVCLVSREYPPDTGWGGIGTYTRHLAHALSKKGVTVHVLSHSLDADSDYMDGDVYVHRIAHRQLFYFKKGVREFTARLEYSWRLFKRLKEIIAKYGIDIVEGPNFFAEPFVYSLFKKVPLVTRLHSPFFKIIEAYNWPNTFDRKLSCMLEDASILRSSAITCSTKTFGRLMAKKLSIAADKISIIPLGIELPELNGYKQEKPRGPVILFVGRFERRKGFHTLMAAVPYVVEECPDASFIFIGRDTFSDEDNSSFRGDLKHSFKEQALKGLPEKYLKNIQILDYMDSRSLQEYFRRCDIFVAPSLFETFGLVYVEAMSYARPVIGSNAGGVPEVVQDGVTGFLVTPEAPRPLAEAIIKLSKNPGLMEKMGKDGRKRVEECFNREIMAENTIKLYKSLLR